MKEAKRKTIIFDLDGTLLNTLEDLTDSVNYILNRHGLSLRTMEEVRTFVGNGILRLMQRAIPEPMSEEEFKHLFEEFRTYYTAHCRIKTNPYDGIMELLNNLKEQGYEMAIVSNKNDTAVKALAEYYFKDMITVAIGQKDGVRKKPAPDTVYEAMKLLGVSKEDVIYVGDSEVDAQTSENAEVDCVLVDWGFRDRDELIKLNANAVISKPMELLDII